MTTHYMVGYTQARALEALAQTGEQRAAVRRLEAFEGRQADVELAVRMYIRADRPRSAERLAELLEEG